MTLGELKKASMALIEEYSDNISSNYSTDEDISRKLNPIIDAVQHELATIKKIRRSVKINNRLPDNLIINTKGINIHNDIDLTFTASKGKSYTFYVDDNAKITIKRGGNIIDSISHIATENGEYERIRGLIDNPNNEKIDIIFSGDNYYTIKDFAIYAANFSTIERIPDYTDYIEYELPNAFYQLEAVKLRNGKTIMSLPSELELKDKNTLIIKREATGEYEIKYFAYPEAITDATDNAYELEIDEDAQRLMMYAIAADVLKNDRSVRYEDFERKYRDKLSLLDTRNNLSTTISFKPFSGSKYLL